jgi:PAS domain S-box-containing protein
MINDLNPLKLSCARSLEIEKEMFEKSERQFGNILENVHLIAVCLDTSGRICFCNEFFRKMTGWALEDILGRDWFETFLPVEQRESFRLIFGRAISEGEIPAHYEGTIVTRHGEKKLVLWNNTVLFDVAGNVMGATCIGQDITVARAAENELRRNHEEMMQLLEAIPSFLIGLGPDRRIETWNGAAERTFGIAGVGVLGKQIETSGVMWDWETILNSIARCLETGGTLRLDNFPFVRPGSKEGFLEVTVSSFNRFSGRVPGLILLGSDVTNRKILESQLGQAQKLEAIGQLASGIAHEINTPAQYVGDNIRFLKDSFADLKGFQGKCERLFQEAASGRDFSAIAGQIQSAADDADLDYMMEEIPKAIDQSAEGIDRITRIVRAMKEFSHPGSGSKTRIDLNRAIESTVTIAKNEWKYVAEMVLALDSGLPPVSCFPEEFNQVILNMIINAAHAIAEKQQRSGTSEKGRITIATCVQGESVEIRIGDTGTGIPEDIRSRVFDPFFTTKEVGKGTGQGLSISRSVIVDKHGGTIDLESEEWKGTVFIVKLPLLSD